MISVQSRPHTYLELAALDSAVPCARLHARNVAIEQGHADIAQTVELVTSELVTNAVRASAGLELPVVRLCVASDPPSVTVYVWDASPQMPVRRDASPDQESGRGLILVDALSEKWDCYREQTGKVTWARVSRQPVKARTPR
jgi:anti-sigma regulatory factor (Ser/Thr protein kinase)